jgi:3-oxoacid CoA-transferase
MVVTVPTGVRICQHIFDGRAYVLERAITTDFALIRAHRADRMGNLQFRGGSRNFNISFAKAARVAIAEVAPVLVEVGELGPDEIDLPRLQPRRWALRSLRLHECLLVRSRADGGGV